MQSASTVQCIKDFPVFYIICVFTMIMKIVRSAPISYVPGDRSPWIPGDQVHELAQMPEQSIVTFNNTLKLEIEEAIGSILTVSWVTNLIEEKEGDFCILLSTYY